MTSSTSRRTAAGCSAGSRPRRRTSSRTSSSTTAIAVTTRRPSWCPERRQPRSAPGVYTHRTTLWTERPKPHRHLRQTGHERQGERRWEADGSESLDHVVSHEQVEKRLVSACALARVALASRNILMPDRTLPYGSWPSSITTDLLTADTVDLGELSVDGEDVYWLEGRASDSGRAVLVRRTPDGICQDLTKAPFNVRSRVYEYGGGAFAVRDGVVVFSNFDDCRKSSHLTQHALDAAARRAAENSRASTVHVGLHGPASSFARLRPSSWRSAGAATTTNRLGIVTIRGNGGLRARQPLRGSGNRAYIDDIGVE